MPGSDSSPAWRFGRAWAMLFAGKPARIRFKLSWAFAQLWAMLPVRSLASVGRSERGCVLVRNRIEFACPPGLAINSSFPSAHITDAKCKKYSQAAPP